jgi:cytochrome c553
MSISQVLRAGLLLGVIPLLMAAKQGAEKPAPAVAAKLCQSCHGAHGEGIPAAGIPRLAGQTAGYLDKQLRDYASGSRENPIMHQWAIQLKDAQRAEVAAYYASLTSPYAVAPATSASDASTPMLLARGHQLAYQGDESRRVQACDNCHGPDGNGAPLTAPYIAGQSAQYLAASLKAWKDGTRKNDDGELMRSVVDRLNEADIGAIAAYFSSLASSPNSGSR